MAATDAHDHPLTAPMPRFLQNALELLRLPGSAPAPTPASAAGPLVPYSGVGLPPPNSPFWQRPDIAEKVLLAVAALEAERSALATQAAEGMAAEQRLSKEVGELKVHERQPYASLGILTRARPRQR